MPQMIDAEVIKALECCKVLMCSQCPKKTNPFVFACDEQLCDEAIDLINRKNQRIAELEAEIEKLTVNMNAFGLAGKNLKEENDALKAKVERLKVLLKDANESNKNLMHRIDVNEAEAIKEFAERLCKDRVSNDPVVIAVRVELKELTEKNDFKAGDKK